MKKQETKKTENTDKPVKSRAARIIDGEIEPEPHEKYLLNLRKRKPFNEWDKDKLREVSAKGAEAVNLLHGEKKTAKQALSNVLTLKVTDDIIADADIDEGVAAKLKRDNPNATLYDLIQAVAVGRALKGNIKAAEYVRDTHGDAPVKEISVTENITTEADRALMRQVAERLQDAESIQIVQDITVGDVKSAE